MILDEQKHRNLYRRYYQGRRSDYDPSKAIFRRESYFTTQPMYAYYYATNDNGKGVVTEYVLRNGVNIFNAQCKSDLYALHKYAIDNNVSQLDVNTLERLKDKDWSFVLKGDDNRNVVIDIIRSLGYDGFFNYEYNEEMIKEISQSGAIAPKFLPKEPAIGVFSKNVFIKTQSFTDFNIILSTDGAQAYKKAEQKFIYDKTTSYLLDGIMPEPYIIKHCSNLSTLAMTKQEVSDTVADAVADFHTETPFAKKIKEEIEKYGHTLDTYDGQLIYKKGESNGKEEAKD